MTRLRELAYLKSGLVLVTSGSTGSGKSSILAVLLMRSTATANATSSPSKTRWSSVQR